MWAHTCEELMIERSWHIECDNLSILYAIIFCEIQSIDINEKKFFLHIFEVQTAEAFPVCRRKLLLQ